jgi:hypothetical protein
MIGVSPRRVSMVRGFLVLSSLMVLCRFAVMASGMRMMLRGPFVVLGCFLRHFPHCYRRAVSLAIVRL